MKFYLTNFIFFVNVYFKLAKVKEKQTNKKSNTRLGMFIVDMSKFWKRVLKKLAYQQITLNTFFGF